MEPPNGSSAEEANVDHQRERELNSQLRTWCHRILLLIAFYIGARKTTPLWLLVIRAIIAAVFVAACQSK